ncbi:MAG: tRNA-dihydrouridine synthase [Candidatus Wolfebacteria bacterium]|nr:tRNA-dihydrouridine synthase [Candidatus Wolfebacteria bacterium]
MEKQGAGAALNNNPTLAKEIITATHKGAGNLPVSVKTRIGYSKNEIKSWLPCLLEENLACLTIHLRTRKEMSDAPARWNLAPEILKLRNKISPETILIGNGDINSLDEAKLRVKESGFDGVMVGRGIFGNPWFFSGKVPSPAEKFKALKEHAELFEKMYKSDKNKKDGKLKNFDIMKKHFKAYVSGFDGAKDLRIKLMAAKNAAEVKRIIASF